MADTPDSRAAMPVDFRALFKAGLWVTPFFAWTLVWLVSGSRPRGPELFGSALRTIFDSAILAFGFIGLSLAVAMIWRGASRRIASTDYWQAAIAVAIITSISALLFVVLTYLLESQRYPDQQPASFLTWFNIALRVFAQGAAVVVAATIYLRRAVSQESKDADRLTVLIVMGLVVALAGIVRELNVAFVNHDNPISLPYLGLTFFQGVVYSLVSGLGRVLFFGIPAAMILRGLNRENNFPAVLLAALIVAALCWLAAFSYLIADAFGPAADDDWLAKVWLFGGRDGAIFGAVVALVGAFAYWWTQASAATRAKLLAFRSGPSS